MHSLLRRLIGEDVVLHTRFTESLHAVSADPGQIEQVVMNLAVNARDAMPTGGRLTIETANVALDADYVGQHQGSAPGPHVMLAVSDTGTGMDEDTRRQIFEPFFTTKGPGKGTGLGLSMVYGIVKQSRGSIWVYSEINQGSTFKIYLPSATLSVTGPAAPRPSSRVLKGTETVLLVEDQAEVRTVTRETLRRHGYTVIEAASGADALGVAREHPGPIQLVLTDVVMPGMSGRQMAAEISVQRPGIRVLYTSGYTDEVIVHHGVLEPGLAFVQKPYTTDGLLQKVREVLDAPTPPVV
jgi:CheY-like chemotaxis protein